MLITNLKQHSVAMLVLFKMMAAQLGRLKTRADTGRISQIILPEVFKPNLHKIPVCTACS